MQQNIGEDIRARPIVYNNLFVKATENPSMKALYDSCAPPPALHVLDQYRTDGQKCMKFYSCPEYFVEEWRSLIQREQDLKKAKRIAKKRNKEAKMRSLRPPQPNPQQLEIKRYNSQGDLIVERGSGGHHHHPHYHQQQQQYQMIPPQEKPYVNITVTNEFDHEHGTISTVGTSVSNESPFHSVKAPPPPPPPLPPQQQQSPASQQQQQQQQRMGLISHRQSNSISSTSSVEESPRGNSPIKGLFTRRQSNGKSTDPNLGVTSGGPPPPPPPPPPASGVIITGASVTTGIGNLTAVRSGSPAFLGAEGGENADRVGSVGKSGIGGGRDGGDAAVLEGKMGLLSEIRGGQFKLRRVETVHRSSPKKLAPTNEVAAILMRRVALEMSDSESSDASGLSEGDDWD
ncbi:Wiskott-Aldrich syndrome protein member 1 [Blyttiomyces sp. JEL0837]|nr:Wiskott-Aldrich syndrome protein member 1 [Blyttiomyces sp. JEL0837]